MAPIAGHLETSVTKVSTWPLILKPIKFKDLKKRKRRGLLKGTLQLCSPNDIDGHGKIVQKKLLMTAKCNCHGNGKKKHVSLASGRCFFQFPNK